MSRDETRPDCTGLEVAIIGMAGRFPGARSVEEFWANLRDGVESITFFTKEELHAVGVPPAVADDPAYVGARGVLRDVELFDAAFFGFSPKEADITDPQQRLLLECAWEALENSGYDAERFKGRIGLFAGVSTSSYYLDALHLNRDIERSVNKLQVLIGNDKDHAAARISYKMNLRGPSVCVQTACSTSLVAVHLACQNLLSGESDMALAGGASVALPQHGGYFYQDGGILSPDGHCRAFDARAQGTVSGNGVGLVVLKRLEDALSDGDHIHAVIKGSAINNDGSLKAGYTAPSEHGQAEAIRAAQAMAEVEAESVTYVEAHGTGTPIGDPIELAALRRAFGAGARRSCAIGSVKTNIGHLDAGAGVTGLIKTVLALKHRQLPPSLNFSEPNPKIDFENGPFYVNSALAPWDTPHLPRRAGVSSFGLGGTNAHVVLEEAPAPDKSGPGREWQLLPLSAKTNTALEKATDNLVRHLEQNPGASLADVAYTLQVGRRAFGQRRVLVCRDAGDAFETVRSPDALQDFTASQVSDRRPVVFMFPGQGTQRPRMGYELYHAEPVFREQINGMAEILRPHLEMDLREVLGYAGDGGERAAELLMHALHAQPVIFAFEYALARLWMSWGVQPQALIGHSLGEYAAACLAGVFAVEDALRLVAKRGRLLQDLPPGNMLAVPLTERDMMPLIEGRLSLAAVNGPALCVAAGPPEAVAGLQEELNARGIDSWLIHTAHAAHSEMLDPLLPDFAALVRQVPLAPPKLPFISNVTGTWITEREATDPEYWVRHLRQTVRFSDGLDELFRKQERIYLEVGPGSAVSTLVRRHPNVPVGKNAFASLPTPREPESETRAMTKALGHLWLSGAEVPWRKYHSGARRLRVPLPTYPFDRKRHWVERTRRTVARPADPAEQAQAAPAAVAAKARPAAPAFAPGYTPNAGEVERSLAGIWQDLLGVERVRPSDNFFELGGDSLLALQLQARLRQTFEVSLPLHDILLSPTPEELARRLAERLPDRGKGDDAPAAPAREAESSLLVEMQPGDTRQPLFLIHPGGGSVFIYRPLAGALGLERAVYAVHPRGLDGEAEPLRRIEQMARHYLHEVRTVQPQGPYLLGGASLGGAVAFEMSRQLQAEGQRVEVLALFDTPCGEQLGERPEDDAAILARIAGPSLGCTPADLRRLDPEEQVTHFIREMRALGRMPGVEDAQARNLVRVWRANTDAIFHYAPGPYAGRVVFFRARERSPGYPPYPELPWVDAAAGGAEVHVVPGDHEGMLVSPNVETLAARLREVIAAAAQAAPEGGGGPPAHDAGLPRGAAPLAH